MLFRSSLGSLRPVVGCSLFLLLVFALPQYIEHTQRLVWFGLVADKTMAKKPMQSSKTDDDNENNKKMMIATTTTPKPTHTQNIIWHICWGCAGFGGMFLLSSLFACSPKLFAGFLFCIELLGKMLPEVQTKNIKLAKQPNKKTKQMR